MPNVAKKTVYVHAELPVGSPVRFRNHYDGWLCTWENFRQELSDLMEQMELGQSIEFLKITVLEMTDKQYERYCRNNEIDLE